MSLKLALTLIVVGLVAKTCAYAPKLREDDADTKYGFSYSNYKRAPDTITMRVDKGTFIWFPFFRRNSTWSFHAGKQSNTITQKTKFPYIGVQYRGVQASVGDIRVNNGRIYTDLGEIVYSLSLTATGDDEECELKATAYSPRMDIHLDIEDMDRVYGAFQEPAVKKSLQLAVWRPLAKALPPIVASEVERYVAYKLDAPALCAELLAATEDHFPKPRL